MSRRSHCGRPETNGWSRPTTRTWSGGNYPDVVEADYPDVVEDADHWRHVRFSGELALVVIAQNYRRYDVRAMVENGFLDDIWLDHDSQEVANEIPEE